MSTLEQDARHLVELYDQRCTQSAAAAGAGDHMTGEMIADVLRLGRELDAACEAFRRRYYPRRAEVIVGLWAVMVCSATRRRTETVLDLFDQYRSAERVVRLGAT